MKQKDSLGGRIKGYEEVFKQKLIRRMPVIIRVDGKAFHTLTKRITPAMDATERTGPGQKFHRVMMNTALNVAQSIQNCVFAYTQSDEISFLLRDWDNHETEQWFDGTVQKLVSIAASFTTAKFADAWYLEFGTHVSNGFFDARVFNLSKEEVANYFIWRQQDWTRNSVRMIGRKFFSHKQLVNKNNSEVQDMLMREFGVNWNDYDTWKKRGTCVNREVDGFKIDTQIPIFTKDRNYIERFLEAPDEQ